MKLFRAFRERMLEKGWPAPPNNPVDKLRHIQTPQQSWDAMTPEQRKANENYDPVQGMKRQVDESKPLGRLFAQMQRSRLASNDSESE